MGLFSSTSNFIFGAVVGGATVWAFLNPEFALQSKLENIFAQLFESRDTGISAPERIRQLTRSKDFEAVEEILAQAHQASLDGANAYGDLREMFRVFESTAPEMREFTETWLDEMPDSPYALTGLTWNLYAAGWHMRGTRLPQFSYEEGMLRFLGLHERATRLARRAYEVAPNLVPASDAVLRLTLTNGANTRIPMQRVNAQVRILENVMALTPNRGSLLRALTVTQPKWGGNFEGAVLICSKFANLVTDVEGYNTDICLVDAAYTYNYGAAVKERARVALEASDEAYLDFARRQDWEPGYSRRADNEVLEYLAGEGKTDIEMARNYDQKVSYVQGTPPISGDIYAANIAATRAKLGFDPYNPALIKALTEPPFGVRPGANLDVHDENFELAKLALNAAPYDADVWNNIAMVSHGSTDPASAEEIPYFENSMIFANYKPAYFFEYLSAKRADYSALYGGKTPANLTEQQTASLDEAVTCPLIKLIRFKEMMCAVVQNDNPYYYTTNCEWDPVNDGFLDRLISQAETRNSCDLEINTELFDLFVKTPTQTDFEFPEALRR